MEKVCVIGLGYIGLPTASLLATKGFEVHGVDIHPDVVDTINKGEIHIVEPDLDVLVKSAVHSGNLKASTQPAPSDIFIIAVPTPFKDDHHPDLSYIESATQALAPHLSPGNLIILESTSPVGATEKVAGWLKKLRPDLNFPERNSDHPSEVKENRVFIAHCPERVLPGQILKELVDNDRIIGGIDRPSGEKAEHFYQEFINGKTFLTDARTAELVKLSENAFRDVNIAYANELSVICEKMDIDVWDLIQLANHHPRVNILQPGPGVGGHCIAVDPWFIVDSAPEEAKLIRTARETNDQKPNYVIKRIKQKAAEIKTPSLAFFGLTFKADIDDLRESPAVEIVKKMAKDWIGEILVVEPHIQELPKNLTETGNIKLVDTLAALKKSDLLVLLVNHREFESIDRSKFHGKVVVDTRGLWR